MVIRFLIEKEFKQMMRNVILPVVFVMLPLGMINVIPRAATQEVKNLEKEKRLQQAMLDIKKKYGKNAILKGMNLEEGATAIERNRQIGGHKA